MQLQPRTRPFMVILLGIGSVALVVGNWHYVGDVIAGAFVGSTAGYVAAELWNRHVQSHPTNLDLIVAGSRRPLSVPTLVGAKFCHALGINHKRSTSLKTGSLAPLLTRLLEKRGKPK